MSIGRSGLVQPANYNICTSSTRPASPAEGLMIYETDTDKIQIYSGSAWVPFGNLIICTSSTRPASPFEGMQIYETDTDDIQIYSGSAWYQIGPLGAFTSYTPTWSGPGGTAPSLGNGSLAGAYIRIGRQITGWWQLIAGTTTSSGTGTSMVMSFPVTPTTTASTRTLGRGYIYDASVATFFDAWAFDTGQLGVYVANSTYKQLTGISGTVTPTTAIGNGDTWRMQFCYEAAS